MIFFSPLIRAARAVRDIAKIWWWHRGEQRAVDRDARARVSAYYVSHFGRYPKRREMRAEMRYLRELCEPGDRARTSAHYLQSHGETSHPPEDVYEVLPAIPGHAHIVGPVNNYGQWPCGCTPRVRVKRNPPYRKG